MNFSHKSKHNICVLFTNIDKIYIAIFSFAYFAYFF